MTHCCKLSDSGSAALVYLFFQATSVDKEMIDILASLAGDDRPSSQRSRGSEGIVLDQGTSIRVDDYKC